MEFWVRVKIDHSGFYSEPITSPRVVPGFSLRQVSWAHKKTGVNLSIYTGLAN